MPATHRQCPECDCSSTKQHQETYADCIEVVRTCDECPTQWTVVYAHPVVEEVQHLA